jgi:hypothetical protein
MLYVQYGALEMSVQYLARDREELILPRADVSG